MDLLSQSGSSVAAKVVLEHCKNNINQPIELQECVSYVTSIGLYVKPSTSAIRTLFVSILSTKYLILCLDIFSMKRIFICFEMMQ